MDLEKRVANLEKLVDNLIKKIDNTKFYQDADNAGMMLLRLLASKGCKKVNLAGFDGFRIDIDNYATSSTITNRYSLKNTEEKNKSTCSQIMEISNTMLINFLTPSIYKEMIDEKI